MSHRRKKQTGRKRTRKKPSRPPEQFTVDRVGASGDGMAGEVAIPFSLPGESVIAKRNGRTAELVERTVSSEARAQPVCQHFGRPGDACGGCTLQHFGLENSLEWKIDQLKQSLLRVFSELPEIIVHQSSPKTRRRAKFAIARGSGKFMIGFRQYRAHQIVSIAQCEILHPEITSILEPIRASQSKLFPSHWRDGEVFITHTDEGLELSFSGFPEEDLELSHRETWVDFSNTHNLARVLFDHTPIVVRAEPALTFDGIRLPIPNQTFLQATPDGETTLQKIVTHHCKEYKHVADFFCGLGTFAVPLASCSRVTAVDMDGPALRVLTNTARQNGLSIEVEKRNIFDEPFTPEELVPFDAVVFDPPRAGAQEQSKELANSEVQRVVAVSCNPKTLSTDLTFLQEKYDLRGLYVVDQFLWSPHIEVVAVLDHL